MKKQTKLFLIILCVVMAASVVAFAACKDNNPPEPPQITVTVNANIGSSENQTFKVDSGAEFFSKLASYIPQDTNGLTFAGWYDANGAQVNEQTRWESDGTVTARWTAAYKIEYYLETDKGFTKSDELTASKTDVVGVTVTADEIELDGYFFDAYNSNNVVSATLGSGTVLKLYYKAITFTVTFNKNDPDATGEMEPQVFYAGVATRLSANGFTSSNNYEFGGWNTSADGTGDFYPNQFPAKLTRDITLYAQWRISYTEEIWVEKLVDGEYKYVRQDDLTKTVTNRFLGNSVKVETVYNEDHYVLDYQRSEGEIGSASVNNGAVLRAYYSLQRFTITYSDSGKQEQVRYGEQYTIRTSETDNVTAYCDKIDGSGKIYAFGDVITLEQNLVLYPVFSE